MSAQVPSLDLREFDHDRDRFVQRLGTAYEEFGFCGISHHGIDTEKIESAYQVFRSFFDLSHAKKSTYHLEGSGGARGYTGFGIETAKDSSHPDLKEFWHVGRELPVDHPYRDKMPDNFWPEEVKDFKTHAYGLYQALDELGCRMLRAMALYLKQDEYFFDHKVNQGNSILRPIHYPPVKDTGTLSVRAGQHEDINLITLLIGAEGPGLEILSRQDEWIPVTAIPGAIVCNIGDMMQRLTNHVFPSTTHRVVNPPGALAEQSRYSIPFFLHPNADYMIETLDSCISEENPNRYPEPLAAHDYLTQRLKEIGLLK